MSPAALALLLSAVGAGAPAPPLAAAPGAGAAAPLAGAAPGARACPATVAAPDAPGGLAIVHTPARAAFEHNRAGRDLYRARRFEEARARYRTAAAADPEFLAPFLNIATSYCLEERRADAVAEALALARRAYVPWARAIREAADLAPLRTRPEWRTLEQGLKDAGSAWGGALEGALYFIARTEAPVRVPAGAGVLVLDPKQEVFAWQPRTGRYLPVTAEDGRVLALAPAPDGRRLVYARGEKLVRTTPDAPTLLRDLTVRSLETATMTLGPAAHVDGDVESVELSWPPGAAFPLIRATRAGTPAAAWLKDAALVPTPEPRRARGTPAVPVVRLTGQGVRPALTEQRRTPCPFTARDRPSLRIEITSRTNTIHTLDTPNGAGLRGLPFPASSGP